MALEDFKDLIDENASLFRLDPNVVEAVIITESSGDPWSYRVEPAYAYVFHVREWATKVGVSYDSEMKFQMTSMGLMQPMGGVCREYGFDQKLSEIFQPELSMKYGCMHLQKKAEKYGSDPATLYAAYNAGSPRKTPGGMWLNQKNVDRFMANLRSIEGKK